MKSRIGKFLDDLTNNNPDFVNSHQEEMAWLRELVDCQDEAPKGSGMTENGKKIIKHMQDTGRKMYRSRDIAEDTCISSRAVSGALRKLVTDGFCEKIGKDPVIYSLTEKGKNYIIN